MRWHAKLSQVSQDANRKEKGGPERGPQAGTEAKDGARGGEEGDWRAETGANGSAVRLARVPLTGVVRCLGWNNMRVILYGTRAWPGCALRGSSVRACVRACACACACACARAIAHSLRGLSRQLQSSYSPWRDSSSPIGGDWASTHGYSRGTRMHCGTFTRPAYMSKIWRAKPGRGSCCSH